MTLTSEVKDWLVDNVGWGDPRWWQADELEHHFETCLGGVKCDTVTGFRCYGEGDSWGWTPMALGNIYQALGFVERATFVFRHAKDALLFKLTWGGM